MKQIAIIRPSSILELLDLMSTLKKRNVFLIRGKESFEKCGAKDKLTKIFNTCKVREYYNFNNNPKYDEAIIAYNEFKKSNSDILLAIGGGSVIDMAKLIKHFYIIDNTNNFLPFIAIPTTAGTGSEATSFAVVYKNGIKESIESAYLLPNHAIIDSDLLKGQSHYQMAVSGIDAFSQGIESYWNINATDESLQYAELAIKLMWENLEAGISGNSKSLELISNGSYLAGKAINITKTTAPHAFSYGFTSECGLPHGHAVALFLPFFAYYNNIENLKYCVDKKGVEAVTEKIKKIKKIMNIETGSLSKSLFDWFKKLNIETDFSALGIDRKKYNEIVNSINYDRLKNNPYNIGSDEILEIYSFNLQNANL